MAAQSVGNQKVPRSESDSPDRTVDSDRGTGAGGWGEKRSFWLLPLLLNTAADRERFCINSRMPRRNIPFRWFHFFGSFCLRLCSLMELNGMF